MQGVQKTKNRRVKKVINTGRDIKKFRAMIPIGPSRNTFIEVYVNGFDEHTGEPFNICSKCGSRVRSVIYYEVGCKCEYECIV